jgi:hypothetical protein
MEHYAPVGASALNPCSTDGCGRIKYPHQYRFSLSF